MVLPIIYPIAASVLQAASFTLDKVVLSFKKITYKTYIGVSFPLMFLITLVIFFIFKPPLSWSLITGDYIYLYLIALVFFAIITNILFYKALDQDKLGEMEIISLLGNIPLIIVTGILFTDERNWIVIFLAVAASSSVIWAHWKGHHLQIIKNTKIFLVWTLASFPIRGALSKALLAPGALHPITLELLSSGALALILAPFFYKSAKRVSLKPFLLFVVLNILTVVAWILYFFGYQTLGVVQTVLIFSLQPLIVYFASILVLKEKLEWKKFVSFVIILIAIGLSQVFA
jgi:drug/metabolite transporter (DMT)-like permease